MRLMVLIAALSLVACGDKEEEDTSVVEDVEETEETEESEEETGGEE